jgi:hypothetical protein
MRVAVAPIVLGVYLFTANSSGFAGPLAGKGRILDNDRVFVWWCHACVKVFHVP